MKQHLPRRLVLGLALAVAVHITRAWPSLWTTVDDAWISARYAMHAAHGNGFVYNAGQPPIEGFTNLLWTAWLTLGLTLGVDLQAFMVFSGLGFGALAVALVGACAWVLQPAATRDPLLATAAALILALDIHHAVSATNGLESAMFVAGCLGATLAAATRPGHPLTGALLGLLAAIRPEGLLLGGLLGAASAWQVRDQGARAVARATAPLVAVWTALTAWRLLTYGAWLPNTFAAKAVGSWDQYLQGNLRYLGADGPLWIAPTLGLGLASVGLAARTPTRAVRAAALLAAVGMLAAAMRVYLWMPGARLFVPPLALTLAALPALPRPAARVALAGWLLAALVAPLTAHEEHNRRYDRIHSVTLPNPTQRAMEHIVPHLPDGAWVSTRDAGVLAYFAGPNVHVAETHHRALTQLHPDRADADVLAYTPRDPDLIVLTQSASDKRGFRYGPDARVFRRAQGTYTYLGRIKQHHRRHYDLYVREEHGVPPLPSELVRNRVGPPAPGRTGPTRAGQPGGRDR